MEVQFNSPGSMANPIHIQVVKMVQNPSYSHGKQLQVSQNMQLLPFNKAVVASNYKPAGSRLIQSASSNTGDTDYNGVVMKNPYGGSELQAGHKVVNSNYSLRNSQKTKHSSVGYTVAQTLSAGKQTNIKQSQDQIFEGMAMHSPQLLSANKVSSHLNQLPLTRGDSGNPLPSFIMT